MSRPLEDSICACQSDLSVGATQLRWLVHRDLRDPLLLRELMEVIIKVHRDTRQLAALVQRESIRLVQ